VTSPAPARAAARVAGHQRTAGDEGVAAAVFMAIKPRPGKAVEPQGRRVLEGARADRGEDRRGDADIGDDRLAAQGPRRQQQMAGLLAEEGDGESAGWGDAAHGAAGAVDAARHVDGDDRQAARREAGDDVARQPVDRAAEAGPEQGVDHEADLGGERRRQGLDGAVPARGVARGVAGERVRGAEQEEADRPAGFRQMARRDEPVAAIVAGAAEDGGRARRPARGDRFGDGGAGALHQRLAGEAARDGQPIGLAHLARRQQGEVVGGCGHGSRLAPLGRSRA
jgi:hypothetical protein